MTKLTNAAGHVIANDMVAVFDTTDLALHSSARMTASLLEGTAQSGMHPRTKQKLLETIHRGYGKVLEGRREMISAHSQMVVIHRQSTIRETGFGCWDDPLGGLLFGRADSAPAEPRRVEPGN